MENRGRFAGRSRFAGRGRCLGRVHLLSSCDDGPMVALGPVDSVRGRISGRASTG